jgi:hypothetical protein
MPHRHSIALSPICHTHTHTYTHTHKEAVLDTLKEAADQYLDAGPAFDCLVFNDGSRWRAVIDTDGAGDMSSCTPLANYRDELQFQTLKTVPGCKEVWCLSCVFFCFFVCLVLV